MPHASNKPMLARLLCAALLLASPVVAVQAAPALDNCTGYVTTLPATLSTQGTWCLRGDLNTTMTSGAAITIAANNITLDCNDFKVGGLGSGLSTRTTGVFAVRYANTTVRNCNIRNFRDGIRVEGFGHLIEDNRLDSNTSTGILVAGDGSIVRRNRVLDTGGAPDLAVATGIYTSESVDIIDNTVADVASAQANGANYGIRTNLNLGGSISGNRVRGIVVQASGSAIYNGGSGRIVVSNNDLLGRTEAKDTGIRCPNTLGTVTGNAVVGFTTAIQGCTKGAGNNELP